MNCSTYNPCGKNGYCRDTSDGEITCECKFWWNGTLCNEQTNSGTQVIVLGCLLGVLLILFYGLKIFHSIRLKRKRPKQVKEVKFTQEAKILNLALSTARRKARWTSLLNLILTLILAGVALLAKWAVIQPIHNTVVRRYLSNESVYYDENPICRVTSYNDMNLITFPIACLIIIIFIVRSKRVSCLKNKCYGYGAAPMPIDYLAHLDRKFAAVISAVCVDELLFILGQAINGTGTTVEGVILKYLIRLLQVLIMGIRYYPLLSAVYLNTIFSLACGTFFAWLDFSFVIVTQGMCQPDYYPSYQDSLTNTSNIDDLMKYYGTGQTLIIIQLCADIPKYVCLAYISVKLPILLVHRIRKSFRKTVSIEKQLLERLTREERMFLRISHPNSVEGLYVRNLLRSAKQRPRSQSMFGRLIPKFLYEWRDDFRFSTRVTCVYSSIALLLYFVTIQAFTRILPVLQSIQKTMQEVLDAISTIFFPLPENAPDGETSSQKSNFPVPNLVRPYIFAIFLTFFIMVLQLFVLLANIRRNLFQSFRGDDSEIPRRVRSKNVSYSSGNVHFAGYFIGYLIWGFIIIAVVCALLCFAIEAFIVFGSVRLVEKILKIIIPSILFVLFKQYLNRILAQYIFLQHRGEVLALNNRRALMIYIYFNFFLDAFLGFVSSIMRLIKSLIGGVLYMCRLDYSPLGRKLEGFDGGFSAYCGFIHTECAHRHPVLLVFVSELYSRMRMRQLMENIDVGEKYQVKLPPASRFRRKWKLAVFLIQNPTIVFFRKAFLNQFHLDETQTKPNQFSDHQQHRRLSAYIRRMSIVQQSILEKDADSVVHLKF